MIKKFEICQKFNYLSHLDFTYHVSIVVIPESDQDQKRLIFCSILMKLDKS